MPRAEANKTYQTFVKGLITEAGPLTFPENASVDDLNCELFSLGNRKRRLGVDYESNFSLSTQTVSNFNTERYGINTFSWTTVAGDGNRNFLVVQMGPTLYFYDQGVTPLSNGQKSFTVDLTTFTAPGATNVGNSLVQADSGKGFLFVVGEKIESFYIEYDPNTDTITTTQINIEIRDFEGLDDGLDPEEEPTTLSDEHSYNLKNQGWNPPNEGGTDPVSTYFGSGSKYPPNTKQWWQGKDSDENFSADLMKKFVAGNTLAPRGHFIIKAFQQDRSDVSGVSGIDVVNISKRPVAVAFFAGRVFYAGVSSSKVNGNIYYSQIIEDETKIGKCYQTNDPTSEELSDLLATDGGVIVIPEAGNILAIFPMQTALIVLADNGSWSISGTDGGFKATDFTVAKISSTGIISSQSIVDVEGIPVWCGQEGIYTISQNEINDKFGVDNIARDTIQTFYDEVPAVSKASIKGAYDAQTKKIRWLYRTTAPNSNQERYHYDAILTLDTKIGAFYPWLISEHASEPAYIASIFQEAALNTLTDNADVLDNTDNILVGTDQVVAPVDLPTGSTTFLNYFIIKEGTTSSQWTFGNFTNRAFMDWESVDAVGVDYSSYFETGYELMDDIMRNKQAPYVFVYFNRTETEYTDETYTAWENPSSCFMQARWEWSDHSNSGRFSPKVQVYRFRQAYTPTSGTDFNNGYPVTVSRNKVRGHGKALMLRFESETGKDFDLLGWAVNFAGNTKA